MIPVERAATRARAHLRSTADGPVAVLHRGPDAVYVDVGGRCVGVVGTRATAVPCALRTALAGCRTSRGPRCGAACCTSTTQPLVVGRLVDVTVPRAGALGPAGRRSTSAALVGRGDGLTPYGDDVLCGWLAVHRAAGVATPEVDATVRALAPTTTLLSATLLDCAMHGEVIPEFAA